MADACLFLKGAESVGVKWTEGASERTGALREEIDRFDGRV